MGSNPSVIIPIGTSNPVDLSAGLPLFPDLGTARAGISASARSYKLFDIPILIICTRLNLSVYAGYGFGIVGPAIAFLSKNVTVARENVEGGGGQLTVIFDDPLQMEAGAFVGAFVSGGVTANLQVYAPDPWYKVWAWTWKNVFTINKDFKIDLLKLMYDLIKYLLSKRANAASFTEDKNNKKLEEAKLGVQGFGMVGGTSGVRPNLTATPEVTAPLNLANYVPKLREVNQALAKIDGGISFGPTAHLQYPVTFNFDGFTVEGGLQGGVTRANYGNVAYGANRVTATGSTQFNGRENPSRFTTNVKYRTTVKLAISIHAQVKVAKFFSIGVNTPSLDLTNLLFRRPESNGPVPVENSVSTNVGGGCVLTPNMTLRFEGPDGLQILTGQVAKGTITLAGFQSSRDATVKLEIDPPAANFPSSVTIPAGSRSAIFPFTFQNQCLATGNRSNPSETAPPNPISAIQTYRVLATLEEQSVNPCSDYQAETPLSITNRVLRCQRLFTAAGTSPPWDSSGLASATIKGDIDDPDAPSGRNIAYAVVSFPSVPNEQPQTVPVTFTLLDENRQPYGGSNVEVYTTGERKPLAPSCTLNVTLLKAEEAQNAPNPSIAIQWNSKGQHTGYPNRFYLLLDAGCQYGQTEFWLDVYNWS